jgi:cytochrome c peroxidase
MRRFGASSLRFRSVCAAVCLLAGQAAAVAADEYVWRLPPGFPTPAVPADNPMSTAKVALGQRLFFDQRLSITGAYACASCHRPEFAYTDGRARAAGARGDVLRRAAPSLANVAYAPAYTWADSSVASLEAQMRRPLFNAHPVELGLGRHPARVLAALSADPQYPSSFVAAFPGEAAPLSMDHVIKAIAAFERTLISGRAPFDRYVFDDARDALSASAKRGMALFYSPRVGCASCHFGLNFSGPLIYRGHARAAAIYANTGLYDIDGHGSYPAGDRGLIEVTHRRGDMGRYRVPTLRNIALTAPYMHDGSVATLDEVLERYATGSSGGKAHHIDSMKDGRLHPFILDAAMKQDLLEFLRSLTDPGFVQPAPTLAGFGSAPAT